MAFDNQSEISSANFPKTPETFAQLKAKFSSPNGTMKSKAEPTKKDSPKPKPTLEALPYDIQHTLMKYLDPASSASLALACPAIYPVHRYTKGSVPLKTTADTNRIIKCKGGAPLLCGMLRSWMGKEGVRLKFSWYNERFVTAERWEELEEARWCDGWESS